MTHDVCGPGTIGVFKREFGKTAKVWDRTKVVIIPDHYIFTADSKSNRSSALSVRAACRARFVQATAAKHFGREASHA
jgi:homoaconitase/3-isopropylmalate dehydratase large subunit